MSPFSGFLHHFVLAKLATSSIRVKPIHACSVQIPRPDYFGGISSKEKFSEKIFEENILIKIQPKFSFKYFENLWWIQKQGMLVSPDLYIMPAPAEDELMFGREGDVLHPRVVVIVRGRRDQVLDGHAHLLERGRCRGTWGKTKTYTLNKTSLFTKTK